MDVPLGDTIYPAFFTHDATGAAADADSTPTVNVRENGGAAFTTGVSVANVTTGEYEGTLVCSTGNGYEVGKYYEVAAIAVVGGVTSKQNILRFRVVATETAAGVPKVDATHLRGEAIPTLFATGIPFVAVQDGTLTQAKFGAATGSGGRGAFYLLGGILWNSTVGVTSTTATLPTTDEDGRPAPAFNDALIGAAVVFTHLGSGATAIPSEVRYITDYVASTRVVTLDRALANTTDVIWVTIYAGNGRAEVDVGKWLGTVPAAYSTTRGTTGTALPAIAAEAAGGLYTRGTGAGQINQPANGMVDVNAVRHLGTAYAAPAVAGVPRVDVTHYGGNLSPTNINGVPQVDVSYVRASLINVLTAGRVEAVVGALATDAISAASVSAAAVEKIRDGLLNYAYRSGRSVRGLFRRLGAALEVATGLLGSTAIFKQPDGTTTEYSVTQDLANGARSAVDVTNSEVP